MRRALAIWLGLTLMACGGGGDDDPGDDAVDPFDPDTTSVAIEIDYELGEAPYTGDVIGFGDTFDLTVANLDRLFAGTRALEVPTRLDEMEEIGVVPDEALSVADLLDLADEHRGERDAAGRKTYYVVFVSGGFDDGGGPNPAVLGVSIGDTGVVAMFKDVIESTGSPLVPDLERFVEQSTLIHELGHAIGLVGNGVATTSDHHDAEHGAHCTDQDCVMYWLNEGAGDMAEFAQTFVISGDAILFGDECLGDVDALTGGNRRQAPARP